MSTVVDNAVSTQYHPWVTRESREARRSPQLMSDVIRAAVVVVTHQQHAVLTDFLTRIVSTSRWTYQRSQLIITHELLQLVAEVCYGIAHVNSVVVAVAATMLTAENHCCSTDKDLTCKTSCVSSRTHEDQLSMRKFFGTATTNSITATL